MSALPSARPQFVTDGKSSRWLWDRNKRFGGQAFPLSTVDRSCPIGPS